MTNDRDELALSKEDTRARNTDDDGSSETPPRRDDMDPSQDPRAQIDEINLEREAIVDVLGGLPEGQSLDQTVGTGLDGQPIGRSGNHFGNADAEGLLASLGSDANSPLNVGGGALPGNNSTNTAPGGGKQGPDLNFRARDMSQVSGTDGGTADPHAPPMTAEEKVKARDSNKENRDKENWEKEQAKKKEKENENVDPDADTGGGVVTVEQVERAVVLQGTDTDFVPGAGIHIDDDAPPKRPIDLVTDGGDEDPGKGESGGTLMPPGSQISKPVNDQDGLLSGGLRPNSGPATGGGEGNPNTGRDSFSSTATAATNTGESSFGSGVTNIGTGSTSGIQSVAADNIDAFEPTSEFAADLAVADDLALGFDDLLGDTFAQRSTESDELVPVDANPDEGF